MQSINKYLVNRKLTKQDRPKELTEEEVRSYIYSEKCNNLCKKVTIRYEHGEPIVDIEGGFYFKNDITEIPFQFGKVTGNFNCGACLNLTSLKGCPEEVGRYFGCMDCENLTSLEGCPKKVGGDFNCSGCKNLKSLEGCPENVGKDFDCSNCGKQFRKKEVLSLCKVIGDILC